ncbi:MAG: hypothetical protein EAZ57_06160 [Cytophagales bacterium]|nr:MAG: hypothetical protein EAZ67_08350 [Cytophagales bacterium]TAF60764.1 MAG: hypothetical protein EAZ57_06160 [Cytophagales bacterium]
MKKVCFTLVILSVFLCSFTYFSAVRPNNCDLTPTNMGLLHNQAMDFVYAALQTAIQNNKNQNNPPLTKQQILTIAQTACNTYLTQTCGQVTAAQASQFIAQGFAEVNISFVTKVENSNFSPTLKAALLSLNQINSTTPAQTRSAADAISTNGLSYGETYTFNCAKEILCQSHTYWASKTNLWRDLSLLNNPTTVYAPPSERGTAGADMGGFVGVAVGIVGGALGGGIGGSVCYIIQGLFGS